MKQFIVLFLLILSSLCAEEYADFILLENPLDYSILNKYEQRITDSEKAQFIPFSPLQVIDKNDTLGDGISAALKFQFVKSTFFLLKDDAGNFICSSKKPSLQTFKNCAVIADTIQVLKDNALLVSEKYPSAGKQVSVKKGDALVRVCRYNNSYYVMNTAGSRKYGWCLMPDKSAWKKNAVLEKKEDSHAKTELWNRIITKVESVNETYEEYFNYFNTATQQQRSTPRWVIYQDENLIHCTLSSPYKNTDQLQESTQYLVQDIENMVLGKPFAVTCENGEIYVKPKE